MMRHGASRQLSLLHVAWRVAAIAVGAGLLCGAAFGAQVPEVAPQPAAADAPATKSVFDLTPEELNALAARLADTPVPKVDDLGIRHAQTPGRLVFYCSTSEGRCSLNAPIVAPGKSCYCTGPKGATTGSVILEREEQNRFPFLWPF